jgi:putative endonuclease
MPGNYYVYILASVSRVLYIGVTNDLERRIIEHRQGITPGFASRYHVHRLVHIETYPSAGSAIAREKQLKHWRREKKTALIEAENPGWRDLSEGWFG